jgi:hypothetical protein
MLVMTDEFPAELTAELTDAFDTTQATAEAAADNAASFTEEFDLELDATEIVDTLQQAPYDTFERRWNWWIGDIAVDLEDCTDSRPFRFAGFDPVASVQ